MPRCRFSLFMQSECMSTTSHIDQSQRWRTSCLPSALTSLPPQHFDFEPTCSAAKHTARGPPLPPALGLKTDAEKHVCDRCFATEMNSGQLGASAEVGSISEALSHIRTSRIRPNLIWRSEQSLWLHLKLINVHRRYGKGKKSGAIMEMSNP